MLKRNGALAQAVTESDHKLLVDAADAGNVQAVRLMLDQGFPIETRGTSYGGWDGTALHHAAWCGHANVVQFLLKRGADPRLKHGYGGDALGAAIHGASHAGHKNGPKVVALIARAMTDVDLNKYLEYAKTESNPRVIDVLERVIRAGNNKTRRA
jgi:hypothetical protein